MVQPPFLTVILFVLGYATAHSTLLFILKANREIIGKQVQISANKQTVVRPHFEIVKILDGDGMIVKNIFTNQEEEHLMKFSFVRVMQSHTAKSTAKSYPSIKS